MQVRVAKIVRLFFFYRRLSAQGAELTFEKVARVFRGECFRWFFVNTKMMCFIIEGEALYNPSIFDSW